MRRSVLVAAGSVVVLVVALVGLVLWARDDRTAAPPSGGPAPAATSAGSPSVSGGGGGGGVPGPPATSTRPPAPPSATVPVVPPALRGRDVEIIPTSRPVIALTFDAGANADGLPSILAALAGRGVTATFFLTGDFATGFPAGARSIRAAGHRTGNHTATHPHPLALSDAALRDEITTAAARIRAAGAGDPRPLFRFPYGERDARTIAVANGTGYVAVRWTVDSLGWQGLNGRTAPAAAGFVTDRVLAAARPGAIVLMHIGSNPDDRTTLDATVLPVVIDQLRLRGYGFVTLDALLT